MTAVENWHGQQWPLGLTQREERELARRVGAWARRSLNINEDEFADAYQSAWLRVVRHVKSGRPVRNLEHFLRWEVGNSWRMELRRRRPTLVELEACAEEALRDAVSPDAADQVERLEEARLLLALIGRMEWTRQQLLLLRDGWGLSPTEVCRLVGISRHAYREEHARALDEIYTKAARVIGGDWCKDRRALLRALGTGTVGDPETRLAARHADNCLACRQVIAASRRAGARPRRPDAGSPHGDPMSPAVPATPVRLEAGQA